VTTTTLPFGTEARCDVAIIGAGIVGLSALKAFSDTGVDVRCFERGRPGAGQSAGEVRVFRHRHREPGLVELAVRARIGWRAWERQFGRRLLGTEGLLRFGPDIAEDAERLGDAGVPHALLEREQYHARLPRLRSPADAALFEPLAGVIRARRTIDYLAAAGGERIIHAEVLALERSANGVRILCSDRAWRCERVVICAGVATPALARPLGIDLPVTVHAHARLTFPIDQTGPPGPFACLQDASGTYGASAYGLAVGRSGRYAVGLVGPAGDVPLEGPRTEAGSPALAAAADRTIDYVKRALPSLPPHPSAIRVCHVTRHADDKDAFAISHHGEVTAVAGNNMFKFAPALGHLLARGAA
jgi:sarcosine oxidase